MKFVDGKEGEPGYFISPLPLKPFGINSVRGNRATADEQNKKMLIKLELILKLWNKLETRWRSYRKQDLL